LSLKVEEPTSWLQQLSIAKSEANPNLFAHDVPVEYIIRVCLFSLQKYSNWILDLRDGKLPSEFLMFQA
jgi:hypothetical protein